jgi:glycosyltransferase involved in cell wall biosynthesis
MWVFNGSRTLNVVLKRINQVIPKEVVNQRLIVDDGSTDDTALIAKARGWQVIRNQGRGISNGANTALTHVEAPFFCSFEQDLLLSPSWWNAISKHIVEDNVAAASGVRLPDKPAGLRKLNQYVMEKYRKVLDNPNGYSLTYFQEASTYGHSLDNTMYNTEILRELGGFPDLPNFGAGTDTLLLEKIEKTNLEWLVDYDVCSTHLRQGLRDEVNHYLWCSSMRAYPIFNPQLYSCNTSLASTIPSLVLSPFRAFKIAVKMKEPSVTYVYPIMRFALFRGICKGFRDRASQSFCS